MAITNYTAATEPLGCPPVNRYARSHNASHWQGDWESCTAASFSLNTGNVGRAEKKNQFCYSAHGRQLASKAQWNCCRLINQLCYNNNNNTNICKAHIVNIRAESEALIST